MIELEAVTKIFQRGSEKIWALNEITLGIAAAEFLAITGKSGCGKSTLLHIIGGLELPTSGQVRLQGRELSKMDDAQLTSYRRDQVGIVFQSFNLLPLLTLQENVALPRLLQGCPAPQARQEAAAWLERVDLQTRLQHKPHQVSGGEMQRAAIARALINRPAVLLADEPTGNLDSLTARQIMDLFAQLHREWNQTILLVSHSPEGQRHATRTIQMQDGRLM
jgi:ABC-type lipoprotein export system ATPase subunit